MKKPVVLIFLALAMPVCAQIPIVQLTESKDNTRSEFEHRDSLFREIDLEMVETGFLLEYSLFAEDPLKHTGTDGASVLNTDRWRMLYGGLQGAAVNRRAIELPELTKLNETFKEMNKENKIILPVIWLKYNCFNEEEVSISSEGIKKLSKSNTNLFKSRELFAVSPSVKKVKGRDFTFSLSSDFIFTNKSIKPKGLNVDFGDGKGNTEIKVGETIHVKYSSSGVKKIIISYDTPEGNILKCTSALNVDLEEDRITNGNNVSTSEPDITGEKTGRAYLGATATIEFEVYLSYTNSILDKPFFVLEGFDPYNEFVCSDLYDKIGYAGLRDSLFDQGYDLIFIDYMNSTDFIQRNAYALEELIKYVNNLKNVNCLTKYENVVMGFSMGGLVARYALKDMENRSENHDTRLYISYDSPHRGANVPVGYQQLVKEMYDFEYLLLKLRDLIPEIADAYAIMDSPAAKQMLILNALALSGNTFIDELEQMGMPGQCRNIALGNGSMQSVNYPDFEPGQKLLDLDLIIIGSLFNIIFDANCYALADNPPSPEIVCEWYYRIISWEHSILSVASMPYDNAPGGIYDLESFGINLNDIELLPDSSLVLTSTGFCFVPTVSAFDIPIDGTSLQASVTSQTSTSFTDFFINNDSDNELHIDLTLAKVNWILQQIDIGDVIDCDGSCLYISGTSSIDCSSDPTFTIYSLPQGSSITWESSPNLIRISEQGSNPCTFSSTGNAWSWVRANVTADCDPIVLESSFWSGAPALDYISGPEDAPIDYQHSYYYYPERDYRSGSGASYSMFVEPNTGVTIDPFYEGAGITFTIPDYYRVTAEATNICGTTSTYLDVYVYDWPRFTLSPNPASDEVTISVEESSVNKINVDPVYSISIFNLYGVLQSNYTRSGKNFTIPLNKLQDGNYIIRINDGKQIVSKQLIVKH